MSRRQSDDSRGLPTLLIARPGRCDVDVTAEVSEEPFLRSVVHTDRTFEAMSGWHSATAGSRVGATSILVAYGVAGLIGESGLAGEWSAVGKSA